ncbi:MAG: hypothetical protein JW997_01435 [Actinobacteria bacterium]|nr:hypothetical protein [Actinomycetota bacterium]
MSKIPVVLIEKDEKKINTLLNFLDSFPEIGKTRYSNDILDLETVLAKKDPAVAIIGPTYTISDIEEILKHYNSALNKIRLILLTSEISEKLLKYALRLNMHDVMEFPVQEKDFRDSLKRTSYLFDAKGTIFENSDKQSKKIMFFSTKGGSGNTFLAINFAIAIKQKTKSEVTLYDLNYQFGDVALMMNIYPKNTIFDLVSINKYDDENLDVFLIRHSSGVKILPAPIDPSQGDNIDVDITNKVLHGLSRINNYVVIDAPFSFSNTVISTLRNIDYLFITATKDVPSVKNLKICLQLLERLSYPRENISVILNRSDSKVDFEIDEIEKTIKRKIDFKISSDRIVPISINKGIPAVISAPRSIVTKNIIKMIDIVNAEPEISKIRGALNNI